MSSKKINLLLDHQIFSLQNYGGITTYFVGLMNNLKISKIKFQLPVLVSSNPFACIFSNQLYLNCSDWTVRMFLKYVYFGLNSLYTLYLMRDKNINIYHATYFEDFFLNTIRNLPLVITIYDCSYEELGSNEFWTNRILKKRERLIERANAIISISDSVRNDLLNYYNVDRSKITTIHLFSPITRTLANTYKKHKTGEKYLLYIGTRSFNKNFNRMLKVFKKINNRYSDINLICAGGGKFTPSELQSMRDIGILEKVAHVEYGNDLELIPIYKQALMFVYPSLKEGFGIPLLGSFACGCPVVASDIPVFNEIAADAFVKFNPLSLASIEKAILKVIDKRVDIKRLILNGYRYSDRYTSKKTTDKTIELYKSLLNAKI